LRVTSKHNDPVEQITETGQPTVIKLKGKGRSTGNGGVREPAALKAELSTTTALSGSEAVVTEEDRKTLDAAEQLAADTILDDDEGDAPGDKDEVQRALVVKKPPRFSHFRASPVTFDLWGTSDRQGMDERIILTTKTFAPQFEDDVELRRVRFFETVTSDGVVYLVWCVVPEKGGREPNSWQVSKLAALEHAQKQWTTMRSRTKLAQYTFRASSNQAKHGEPKFSGRTREEWVMELKKLGLLVDNKDHEFYRRATDSE
jgi:hypothetical protein